MDPNAYCLSQDKFNAHQLGVVMNATRPNEETGDEARTRCASIVEIFKTFEAANAMESMIACHCITLQFVVNAAMRDAGDVTLDPALLIRMRASAMALSKTLHLWMKQFDVLHARNELRAAEARPPAERPVAPAGARPVDRLPREQPRPMAARPVPPVPPATAAQAPPVFGMKEALLSSAAVLAGTRMNGRLVPETSVPCR